MSDNFEEIAKRYREEMIKIYGKREKMFESRTFNFNAKNSHNNKDISKTSSRAVNFNIPKPIISKGCPARSNSQPIFEEELEPNEEEIITDYNAFLRENNIMQNTAPPKSNSQPIFEEELEPNEEEIITDYNAFLRENNIMQNNDIKERYPEPQLPDFISNTISQNLSTNPSLNVGSLKVEVRSAQSAIPLSDALVTITSYNNDDTFLIHSSLTNDNGNTQLIDMISNDNQSYEISIYLQGFFEEIIKDIDILDGITSIQSVNLIPLPKHNFI